MRMARRLLPVSSSSRLWGSLERLVMMYSQSEGRTLGRISGMVSHHDRVKQFVVWARPPYTCPTHADPIGSAAFHLWSPRDRFRPGLGGIAHPTVQSVTAKDQEDDSGSPMGTHGTPRHSCPMT